MLKINGLKPGFKMPQKWVPLISNDKFVFIYMEDRIIKECHRNVHERIFTDTTKYHQHKFSELYHRLQLLIKKEAINQNIDVKQVKQEVEKEMDPKKSHEEVYAIIEEEQKKAKNELVEYRSPP